MTIQANMTVCLRAYQIPKEIGTTVEVLSASPLNNMKNPCKHLKVERRGSGLKQALITTLSTAVGQSEEQTKKLFNL